jgi:hypothetical protein
MEQHLNKLGPMAEKLDAIGALILAEVKVMVMLMSLPESYQFLIMSLESLESINPKKITWAVVATMLLNEKLMKKEKYGSIESSTKTILMLTQKKYESRSGTRDKSNDVYN